MKAPVYILNIETSTTVCSVSVAVNGKLAAEQELDNGYTHAENLHLFALRTLKDSGIEASRLSAVSVSKGPGSYTGLRIGVSAAKGLAYALKIPLLSLETLRIMAVNALTQSPQSNHFCPMLDARRMEVYTAVFDRDMNAVMQTEALVMNEAGVAKLTKLDRLCVFGNGMPKCQPLLENLPSVTFLKDIVPSARNMCLLSHQKYIARQFEDLAYFEPFYLKDFLISPPKL